MSHVSSLHCGFAFPPVILLLVPFRILPCIRSVFILVYSLFWSFTIGPIPCTLFWSVSFIRLSFLLVSSNTSGEQQSSLSNKSCLSNNAASGCCPFCIWGIGSFLGTRYNSTLSANITFQKHVFCPWLWTSMIHSHRRNQIENTKKRAKGFFLPARSRQKTLSASIATIPRTILLTALYLSEFLNKEPSTQIHIHIQWTIYTFQIHWIGLCFLHNNREISFDAVHFQAKLRHRTKSAVRTVLFKR